MGLSPMFRLNETGEGVSRIRAHRQAESAVTKYRVLDSRAGCSLVELEPLTGTRSCWLLYNTIIVTVNYPVLKCGTALPVVAHF